MWLHYQRQAVFLKHTLEYRFAVDPGGPITIIPLAFFTAGTRMLPMATVGILFYVTPSLQFLSGVVLLGEAFSLDKLVGFIGIWIGLAIFSYSLLSKKTSP